MLEGTAGARRRSSAATCSVAAEDPDLVLVGTGSEVHVVRRRRRAAGRGGHPRPGDLAALLGPVRRAGRRPYQDAVLPAEVPTLAVEAGTSLRLGPLGRRQRRHRPVRRLRPRRPVLAELGFTPEHVAERARRLLDELEEPPMTDRTASHELHEHGQSPWLDNLRRGWLTERRAGRAGSTAASAASPRTRRSSRRRSAPAPTTTSSSASSIGRRHRRQRRLLGPRRSPTSAAPSTCSARSTTRATASTATCRSRSRPTSPATPPAPRPPPASSTSASPSPTST